MKRTMLAWAVLGALLTGCADATTEPTVVAPSQAPTTTRAPVTTAPRYVSPDDQYLTALARAGVNYGTRETGVGLGRAVCPAITAGATFNMMVDAAEGAYSPAEAAIIVVQAHQVYCPTAVLR